MVDPFGTLQLEWMQKMDQTNQFDPTWRIIPVSKWLITMVSKSPKDRVGLDPLQMAVLWLINGGDPNYFLTGMILQVVDEFHGRK